MKRLYLLALAGAISLVPEIAVAQAAPGRDFAYYHGPSMMWGFAGWRDSGMLFGPVFMIVLVAALVAGTIYLLRLLVPGAGNVGLRSAQAADPAGGALAILRERFARGEIDAAEYDERRSRLLS